MGYRTYSFAVESSAPPHRFIAAASDFTPRRLHYWPTLTAKRYAVHSIGERSAEVDEGEGPVWSRVRYEWNDDTVRYVTLASNAVAPGDSWQMRASPRGGGGSRIEIRMDFHWHGIGLFAQVMADLLGTDRFFARDMRETVRRVEAEADQEPEGGPMPDGRRQG